ncbi:splicing factor Cactin [Silene latifolia]|uniref:splicing factor Cactin n=1 Tax=Silene latifolia TaxID=37657 RepID=UPI003D76D942
MGKIQKSSSSRADKSSSRKHRRRHSDDDSDSPSASDSSPDHRSSRRRRRRSSSPESSDGEDDRRSRRKAVSEEEIKEYLAKKAQKKAMRVAKKLKTTTVSGYSNDSNPFGDANLNEKFVWGKKIQKDVTMGVPMDEFTVKAEKRRQKERMAEIEKVKKRREERAAEKAQREEEMMLLQRERARAEADDFEKKEVEFHFDQSKVRSKIRLREGRMKPIDVLTTYLDETDEFDVVDLDEPYMVFKGLTVKEMEELHDDIKLHLNLDRQTPTHTSYWQALMVVCEWELGEARRKDAIDRARVRGEQPPAELLAEERGLHSSIETDVRNFLEGKSHKDLEELQAKIESDMRSGEAKVVEFWEAVLKRLHIYKAKACLKEIYAKMLRRHLNHLEQPLDGHNLQYEKEKTEVVTEPEMEESREFLPEPITTEETQALEAEEREEEEEEEEEGSFSPQLLHGDEAEEAIDPDEDKLILEKKRLAVLKDQQRRMKEAMTSKRAEPEDDFEIRAKKVMGPLDDDDAILDSRAEINLDSQVYWWHDKYRPRKPKYFNRVHTGYEWNKYNQTHYDHDNPPPKVVQGYKFNIFYPDLVDKQMAPTYVTEKDGDSDETCIIRFHAGPPYEDIAFRIVNKEWEYSHKKGYKCTFERGILHLYFNFKRYRYRR